MNELLNAIGKLKSTQGKNRFISDIEDTLDPKKNSVEDKEKYNILGGLFAASISADEYKETMTNLIELKAVYSENKEIEEDDIKLKLMDNIISCFFTASVLCSKSIEEVQVLALIKHQSIAANS